MGSVRFRRSSANRAQCTSQRLPPSSSFHNGHPATGPAFCNIQHDFWDSSVPFDSNLSYVNEPLEVVQTTLATFYWPTGSSPSRTRAAYQALGVPFPDFDTERWAFYLKDHPDQLFVHNLLRGLQEGFCIGYNGSKETYFPPERERSDEERDLIATEFEAEIRHGRLSGPHLKLRRDLFPFVKISPTFSIPKKDGGTRRIDHLSYPEGNSVNDGIDTSDQKVHFATYEQIGEVLAALHALGLFSNRDVEDAYRHVPLHPQSFPCCVSWVEGWFYVNTRGLFGLNVMPFIFSWMAETVRWIILHFTPITHCLSILDDYLLTHESDNMTPELAAEEMRLVDSIFTELGLPLKASKSHTGVSSVVFMGIRWDIPSRTAEIPKDKCECYLEQLRSLLERRPLCIQIREYQRLVGRLTFVSPFLPCGRVRLSKIYGDLRKAQSNFRYVVHFSRDAWRDIAWFASMLEVFPRSVPFFPPEAPSHDNIVVTDGAPEWGIGGFFGLDTFSLELTEEAKRTLHSTYVELLALVVSCMLWAPLWFGRTIFWKTDCECHVSGIKRLRVKAPELLPLHQALDLFQLKYNFRVIGGHLPGKLNGKADALSRGLCEARVTHGNWRTHIRATLTGLSIPVRCD